MTAIHCPQCGAELHPERTLLAPHQCQGLIGIQPSKLNALLNSIQGARPAAGDLAAFCPTPSDTERRSMMREQVLLDGVFTFEPGISAAHGTPGYAALYLEWEGLMKREAYQVGPLVPQDSRSRFTLTQAGQKARNELLTPTVKP